ncbi:MAG: metal ABC transporter permease [Nitrospirae bacterium]|nr:metal ABC transporter permease [Nitrospirota bacterium]
MDFIEFLDYGFIQRALIAGSLISVLCAVLGVVLVLRRLSMIGDGLSHVTFGGVALAMALNFYPLAVSLPIVVVSSFGILKMMEKARVFGDAAIAVVSSIGIAIGILLASISGGFNVDLFSYLFGNILSISTFEVAAAVLISLSVLAAISFFFDEIFSITFDEDFARASGIPVDRINAVLMVLTAVTVVLTMKVVGIMLTSALLVIPAVTAFQNARGFRNAIIIASISSFLSLVSGVFISFTLNLPAGATIVMVNVFLLCGSFLFRHFFGSHAAE